ncbi:MAG: flagellin FliC [Deltaproteobacteria bacterium]|nr:flagellin FliC [Deltaproteobacteria bacterium]
MMSIRSNLSSLNAQRSLGVSQTQLDSSLAKLSSGYRITKASDDAAGLGVSSNLTAQYRSYVQASRNANDGLSVVQTAEASLNEVSNILTRMRELAMQSASDGIGTTERGYIQEETDNLIAELDRIDATTEFNGTTIFGAAAALTFQVGIRDTADDYLTVDTTAMDVDSASLSVDAVDLSADAATSRGHLADIDAAIVSVSGFRSELGAAANRLQSTLNTIGQAAESVAAANSRIRDVDVAAETSEMSRAQILVQAGVSVLAQANQAPQVALKLLG